MTTAGAPLRLHVTRSAVAVEGPTRRVDTTRATVALIAEGGRVGIAGVGETEDEVRDRLARHLDSQRARGVAARILAAAEKRMQDQRAPGAPAVRIVRPGEDSWWDRKWKSPYALRDGGSRAARHPREVLFVNPLAAESWSPHLLRGLLLYVLWTTPWTRGRTWPPFRRPRLLVTVGDDLDGLDYAELVDQLRSVWGRWRVELPADREVEPPPVTPTQRVYRASQAVWWIAVLVTAFVVAIHGGPDPQGFAVLVAAVGALALVGSRVAKPRVEAERPRRRRP